MGNSSSSAARAEAATCWQCGAPANPRSAYRLRLCAPSGRKLDARGYPVKRGSHQDSVSVPVPRCRRCQGRTRLLIASTLGGMLAGAIVVPILQAIFWPQFDMPQGRHSNTASAIRRPASASFSVFSSRYAAAHFTAGAPASDRSAPIRQCGCCCGKAGNIQAATEILHCVRARQRDAACVLTSFRWGCREEAKPWEDRRCRCETAKIIRSITWRARRRLRRPSRRPPTASRPSGASCRRWSRRSTRPVSSPCCCRPRSAAAAPTSRHSTR